MHPQSWSKCNVFPASPAICFIDNITCDHEKENNRQVMNELKVLSQHLLDYNKRTFEKFMQDIEREYREWISANKKLLCENENLKMQLQEAEKKADIHEVRFYSLAGTLFSLRFCKVRSRSRLRAF